MLRHPSVIFWGSVDQIQYEAYCRRWEDYVAFGVYLHGFLKVVPILWVFKKISVSLRIYSRKLSFNIVGSVILALNEHLCPRSHKDVAGKSKKVYAFGGLCNKKYMIDIQNKMLIYQSKANLDEKGCLVKSHIFKIQKVEEFQKGFCMGIKNSMFHSDP